MKSFPVLLPTFILAFSSVLTSCEDAEYFPSEQRTAVSSDEIDVSFSPSVRISDRTRADNLGLVNPWNSPEVRVDYAIYDSKGNLIKQNFYTRSNLFRPVSLDFSESLRRNSTYKIAVLLTKKIPNTPEYYVFNAGTSQITLNTGADGYDFAKFSGYSGYSSTRYNQLYKTSLGDVYSYDSNKADAYFYCGEFTVPDGLGAANPVSFTLSRPLANVVLLTDEEYSDESASFGQCNSTTKSPVFKTNWSFATTGAKASGETAWGEGKVFPNAAFSSSATATKVTYQGKPMSVLGNFYVFPDAAGEYILQLSGYTYRVTLPELKSNSRVIITPKAGTAFFCGVTNFNFSFSSDLDGTIDNTTTH